ncbi:MAG: phosphatidylinositol-specific phospholipase C1-like protein [Acidimicrobiales bacterium]|nr:phosphatidylinositol-specific phospholipase C1-like protein [Acidimicrobiales bacterium]
MPRLLAFACSALLVVVACSGDDSTAEGSATSTTSAAAEASVRLNQIQVLGSHNSYHLRPPPEVLDAVAALQSQQTADELDYEHRSLTEQLVEFGVRQFELDVYADPEGGRFAQRPAAELVGLPVDSGESALDEPGFKVLHQVDVDFESNCLTLVACLSEIETWSSDNPDHTPIMIMVEAKQDSIADATDGAVTSDVLGVDLTEVLTFDRATFDALEAEILSVFDEDRIITPDDVRGDAATLEEAVLAGEAWPTLDDAAGKVLFSLVDTGDTAEVYVGDAPSLEDRLLFTSSEEGRPDAAFLRVDDPIEEGDRIGALVEAGYLVRTRTDVPGVDAPAGDTTRRDAAIASGAQYLSTDYYVVDDELGTSYVVELPADGPLRCNPVNAPDDCEL